jgi:hypothetical protein
MQAKYRYLSKTKDMLLFLFSFVSFKCKFGKRIIMAITVEDLNDQVKYRQVLVLSYDNLIPFVLGYLKKKSLLTLSYYFITIVFMGITIRVAINIGGYFPLAEMILHSALGLIFLPVLCIPVHELLHIIPYYLGGAKKIRIGMDLRQFIFYVTAHKHVASPVLFRIVAIAPFLIFSIVLLLLIFILPGLWKWSLSLFLFVHTTMCAGDFALLNFYFINRNRKIYTWDDADQKIAYFYEEIG